jgi:hypothetical protein
MLYVFHVTQYYISHIGHNLKVAARIHLILRFDRPVFKSIAMVASRHSRKRRDPAPELPSSTVVRSLFNVKLEALCKLRRYIL